jgi:hypothetical protein
MNIKSTCNLAVLFSFGILLSFSSCKDDEVCAAASTANAGADQIIINTSTTLQGNSPSSGKGTWSVVSGNGGKITDELNPTTTFTGVQGNTYVLRWSISGCPISEDDVKIEFKNCEAATIADAGEDQIVLGTSTTLQGNAPTSGTGTWTIVSGDDGIIANASSATSTFSGVLGKSYTLRWSITGCPASENDVDINFTTNDPTLLTIDKTSVVNGEIITVTGLNFAANYNGGSQIKTVKTMDPNTGAEVFLPILSRTATEIKAVVVGSNGGANGSYDLVYSKKPDDAAATYFPSDLSFSIVAPGVGEFFTSSTFTATNLNQGDEASFGVKNGSAVSADYTVKLVNYNYTTGVVTEYSVTPTVTVNGYFTTMDKIAFNIPMDLPNEAYYVKVIYGGKTLIGGWGNSLNVF